MPMGKQKKNKSNLLVRVITRFRSAITGRFVSKQYADENPDTTVKENRKIIKEKKNEQD